MRHDDHRSQTVRDRLVADGAEFDVLEIKDGVQLYRNPVQTMDKIKSLIPGLCNEDGLDSFWEGAISDSKLGTVPVYVPNLMDSSSKLLDTVLINRVIHQAIPELDSSIKKVIVYYIDITSEDEIRKFIAQDDSTTVEIELRDLKTVLDDVVIGDHAEFRCEETTEGLFTGYTVTIDRFISDCVLGKIMEYNQKAMLNSKKAFKPIEISEDGLELIEFLSLDCTAADGEWHSDSEIKIDKLGYVIRNGVPEMGRITGTGCQLSGMMTGFLVANPDCPLEAAAAAVCTMGLAGEIGLFRQQPGDGNSTLRNRIIDAVSNMTPEQLADGAKFEVK